MRVSVANQAMQNTPHLSPLPSTEGRGEAWIFREAHARRQHAIIVIIISILAMAARLILINQPYVDHCSGRQGDIAAIARNFSQNGFRFGYPQIDWRTTRFSTTIRMIAGNRESRTVYVGAEQPILSSPEILSGGCIRMQSLPHT